MNFFSVFPAAIAIANELAGVAQQLVAGQPVSLPGIRTYLEKLHIEVDITVRPIP